MDRNPTKEERSAPANRALAALQAALVALAQVRTSEAFNSDPDNWLHVDDRKAERRAARCNKRLHHAQWGLGRFKRELERHIKQLR